LRRPHPCGLSHPKLSGAAFHAPQKNASSEVGGDCTDHVREHGGGLAAPGKQHVPELDLQWAARKVVDVRAVLTGGAGAYSSKKVPVGFKLF
jgi:hypothetical protein